MLSADELSLEEDDYLLLDEGVVKHTVPSALEPLRAPFTKITGSETGSCVSALIQRNGECGSHLKA